MDSPGADGSGRLSPRAQQLKDELLGEFSLTVDDVAGILEVDRSTVYRYIQDGALAALKIGREYRLSDVDVRGFLQALIERERRRVAELRTRAIAPAAPAPVPPLRLAEPGPGTTGLTSGAMVSPGVRNRAAEEARRTGHSRIEPAHLLLAMLADGPYTRWDGPFPAEGSLQDGFARQTLERLRVDVPALRLAAEALLPPPDQAPGGGDMVREMAPAAETVFRAERAREAMQALGRGWIGTDCVLLALYTLPEMAGALGAAGAAEEAVRTELQGIAAALAARPAADGPQYGALVRGVARAAADAAGGRGAAAVEPDDLLLALLADNPAVREGVARRALDAVHADIEAIQRTAEARLGAGATPVRNAALMQPSPALRTVVFERAPAAARGLGHEEVGTEHLLLGLYSVPELAQVLEQGGAAHAAVRAAVRGSAPAGAPRPAAEGRSTFFGRYSERAQGAIMYAQEVGRKRGTSHLGTEHILYALISEDARMKPGIARKALDNLGVDVPALRQRIEALLPEEPGGQPREIQFTPRAKALIMEHATAAAAGMGHTYVGTEHLLLGVYEASEQHGRMLEEAGAVREGVEAETLRLLGGGAGASELPLHPGARALARVAVAEARRLGHAAVQPGHYVLALCADDPEVAGGSARAILDRLDVDPAALRRAAEEALPRPRKPRPESQVLPNGEAHLLLSQHAVGAARSLGAQRVEGPHLLLGLHALPEMSQLLTAAGVPEDAVRIEAARLGGQG